jgi:cell division protein FtsB
MKYLTYVLIGFIVAIQYPLWMGKGSWLRVWEVSRLVDQQKEKNQKLAARNAGLDAEVRDLKQGSEAVEERARVELGMIKSDETYYQIVEKPKAKPQGNSD